jgi:hypothetical protein
MSVKRRRSKLELQFEEILKGFDVEYDYEVTKVPYIVPESNHTYTVDWTLLKGLLIETKGYLADYNERKKYVLIKEQHPDIDLRFVFADPNKKCGGMKTTHAQWADKHEFKWCSIKDTEQLKQWITEDHGKAPSNSRQPSKRRRQV